MKNLRKIEKYTLFVFILMIYSCSSYKLINSNKNDVPKWISEPKKNYVVGYSEILLQNEYEKKFQLAQTKSINDVKRKIAYSIATIITSSFSIESRESVVNSLVSFREDTESITKIETSEIPKLTGITIGNIDSCYWEIVKENKKYKLRYFILYPFNQSNIDLYVEKWQIYENSLLNKINDIQNKEYKSIENLLNDISLLEYFSENSSENIRFKSYTALNILKSKISNVSYKIIDYSLGKLIFTLVYNGKIIQTDIMPEIEGHNGISFLKKYKEKNQYIINYDYSECNLSRRSFINIKFDLGLHGDISFSLEIDLSNSTLTKVSNELVSPIKIVCAEWKKGFLFNSCISHDFHFTICSHFQGSFKINKIELIIYKKDRYENKYRKDDNIVFNNLNLNFSGKGIHTFSLNLKGHGFDYDYNYLSEGRIHYINNYNNKSTFFSFSDIETIH